MTIKKALRTAQKVSRHVDSIQREAQQTDDVFVSLEERMLKKPLSTLGVRYDPAEGLTSQHIVEKAGALTLQFGPVDATPTDTSITPDHHVAGGVTIRPMDIFVENWATYIPVEICNDNPDFRPSINWVKKTDRSTSSIFLIDAENSEYYYPVESDITGEIVEGHPRIGLFAFEPFRLPTSQVELHLSSVKLGPPRTEAAKSSLRFVLEGDKLSETIATEIEKPSLSENFRQQHAAASSCSVVALLLASGAMMAIGAATWLVSTVV